jgi:hypothetical protein
MTEAKLDGGRPIMDDKKVAQLEALISGLLVVQQVTLNALIRNNAIGYPQLREAKRS